MHLGFGLYRHQLDREHYRFARQCGATHLVIHLVDYFNQGAKASDQPVSGGRGGGWGMAGDPDAVWTVDQLATIQKEAASEGLTLYAIENFDPAHWHDVLLAGPQRDAQIEGICSLLRAMGTVGIPCMGYNFSLAGVYGRVTGEWARGQAGGVGMAGLIDQEPMLDGMVWNMTFDASATGTAERTRVSSQELWERLAYFLNAVLPVAEAAGVRLCAHPDDPPVERIRDTPRLVIRPELYQRLIELNPSPANGLEFCLGTLTEMPESAMDIYQATRHYAAQERIGYIHFRNVRGKVPHYQEVFIDEGDIDMRRIVQILRETNYEGVLIPDHAPQMTCGAPWHAGMAHAMGYMLALLSEA
ncbi:MAG: mannonate dehydratase [Opitutales bacterium]